MHIAKPNDNRGITQPSGWKKQKTKRDHPAVAPFCLLFFALVLPLVLLMLRSTAMKPSRLPQFLRKGASQGTCGATRPSVLLCKNEDKNKLVSGPVLSELQSQSLERGLHSAANRKNINKPPPYCRVSHHPQSTESALNVDLWG